MDGKALRWEIEDWTLRNCGWEDRDYLGMSQIWRCEAELYDHLTAGREEPRWGMGRMMYEGLMHQADMIERLEGMRMYRPGGILQAEWDERFVGHPDGFVDGDLLEIKSVTVRAFEEVKGTNRARQRDYEQVQVYLLYAQVERAVVIYKCRETGEVWPVLVWAHEETQHRLEQKARRVLEAVDRGERPECRCGRH